jgi:outer membrane cobalamin receptor
MMRHAIPLLFCAACMHAAAPKESGGPGNLITEAEIAESGAVTAYDAILKLHGNFLSNRGKTTILGASSALPVVYLDGVEYGRAEKLRDIPASQIFSIRLYRAWESAKFGSGKTGGVIDIVTKSQ